jgi:hypothetical protein
MRKFITFIASVVLVTALSVNAAAQTPDSDTAVEPLDENIKNILDMMFSELNTVKIETINQVMQLTDVEADVFWPIYREYEAELAKVGYEKVDLLRECAAMAESGEAGDAEWDSIAKRLLKNRQHRLDLWTKYQKRIARELSGFRAAQFLQVENQMAILIDLNIALEMPVIGAPGATSALKQAVPNPRE